MGIFFWSYFFLDPWKKEGKYKIRKSKVKEDHSKRVFWTWQDCHTHEFTVAAWVRPTQMQAGQQSIIYGGGAYGHPSLAEELWEVACCFRRESQFSLRMWLVSRRSDMVQWCHMPVYTWAAHSTPCRLLSWEMGSGAGLGSGIHITHSSDGWHLLPLWRWRQEGRSLSLKVVWYTHWVSGEGILHRDALLGRKGETKEGKEGKRDRGRKQQGREWLHIWVYYQRWEHYFRCENFAYPKE